MLLAEPPLLAPLTDCVSHFLIRPLTEPRANGALFCRGRMAAGLPRDDNRAPAMCRRQTAFRKYEAQAALMIGAIAK